MNLNMRWMTKKDIPYVLRMQDSSFSSSRFDKKFFETIVSSRKNPSFGFEGFNSYISYVCDLDKKPVAYIVYKVTLLDFEMKLHSPRMLKHKNNYPMSGQIVSFCVGKRNRKKGVGRFIVESVINRFSSVVELSLKDFCPRPFLVYALASERDLGSHLFFKSLGFKARSIGWNAFGEGHDGYFFAYESVSKKPKQLCESSK
jgi:hypothetical protein